MGSPTQGWMPTLTAVLRPLGWAAAAVACWPVAYWLTSGLSTLAVLTAFLLLLLLFLRDATALAARLIKGEERRYPIFARLMLSAVTVMLVLAGFEVFLQLDALRHGRAGRGVAGEAPLVMPEEWRWREAHQDGRVVGYYWHGHLHARDDHGMRRTGPFPPKRDGVFRVVAFGDSLTYGVGVAAEEAWPSRAEQALASEYSVEVLNLGVPGANSESLLWVMEDFLPRLEPDLVLYGMCLNDFLPHGARQERVRWAVSLPLPGEVRYVLGYKTRVGRFLRERGGQLLVRAGMRKDFLDDVLENFDRTQDRFASDLVEMNALAEERGLPPVVARVLHQEPEVGSRSEEITRIAEAAMAAAGMTVIPSEGFTREHDGEKMFVSPWELHPNAEAQRIFGEEFARAIAKLEAIQPYRHEGRTLAAEGSR